MYRWSFGEPQWTEEEEKEICLIAKKCLKLFDVSSAKKCDFTVDISEHLEKNKYAKAIQIYSGKVNKKIVMEELLVHDIFRYMHYSFGSSYIKETWNEASKDNYKREVVKESLADFFTYTYLSNKQWDMNLGSPYFDGVEDAKGYRDAAEELSEKWDAGDVSDSPCCGAEAFIFMHNPYGDDDYEEERGGYLFRHIKDEALSGWDIPCEVIMKSLSDGYSEGKSYYIDINSKN